MRQMNRLIPSNRSAWITWDRRGRAYVGPRWKVALFALLASAGLIGSVAAQNPDVYDAATLTITVGGTSQQVFAFNTSRRFLLIQNPTTASEALFCNFGAAASLTLGTSFSLAAGQSIFFSQPNFVPKASVNCNATTSAHPFTAKEG